MESKNRRAAREEGWGGDGVWATGLKGRGQGGK